MFKKILLPLDGSKTAEQALFWAKQYAGPDKAQVVLLQVLHPEYPLAGRPFRAGDLEALHYLQGIERELNYAGIPTKVLLRNEPVSRTIVETARQESCDLIIMTSRGASRVVRWLIGGVTQQVMRLSPVPVLIVRSSIAPLAHEKPSRLLCPQDGSTHAKKIIPWAGRLARFHRARLILLHVLPKKSTSKVSEGLSRQAGMLRRRGIKTATWITEGDPAEQILMACHPGDVLLITTHGHGGIKRLLLGSIAEKVIHQAPVPVLIYKHHSTRSRDAHDLEAVGLFER